MDFIHAPAALFILIFYLNVDNLPLHTAVHAWTHSVS